MRELIAQNPASAEQDNLISLRDLIDFIAHVADCYPKLTAGFAQDLSELLQQHHEQLEQDLREKLVGSLVLLRKKELIDSSTYEVKATPQNNNVLTPALAVCSIPFSPC